MMNRPMGGPWRSGSSPLAWSSTAPSMMVPDSGLFHNHQRPKKMQKVEWKFLNITRSTFLPELGVFFVDLMFLGSLPSTAKRNSFGEYLRFIIGILGFLCLI